MSSIAEKKTYKVEAPVVDLLSEFWTHGEQYEVMSIFPG